jgi:hypothetical protein
MYGGENRSWDRCKGTIVGREDEEDDDKEDDEEEELEEDVHEKKKKKQQRSSERKINQSRKYQRKNRSTSFLLQQT